MAVGAPLGALACFGMLLRTMLALPDVERSRSCVSPKGASSLPHLSQSQLSPVFGCPFPVQTLCTLFQPLVEVSSSFGKGDHILVGARMKLQGDLTPLTLHH